VRSSNPLQQPPSATADIIIACYSAGSLCYRDVPQHKLVDAALRKSYVSALPLGFSTKYPAALLNHSHARHC
jgi:hypothetical protein